MKKWLFAEFHLHIISSLLLFKNFALEHMAYQIACLATNKPEKYTQELCHSSKNLQTSNSYFYYHVLTELYGFLGKWK